MIWNGRAYSAKNIDNNPVEIQWNGQIVTADYFVVPKGTPNKDAAMDFIAWASCKENNGGAVQVHPVRADEHARRGRPVEGGRAQRLEHQRHHRLLR